MDTIANIEAALYRFKTLQEQHIIALGEEKLDTTILLFERGRAFEDLRNFLSAIPGKSLSDACKRQVSDILEKDKTLAEKIKLRQQELSKTITKGKKGKKALKGYQGASNSSSRFMKISG